MYTCLKPDVYIGVVMATVAIYRNRLIQTDDAHQQPNLRQRNIIFFFFFFLPSFSIIFYENQNNSILFIPLFLSQYIFSFHFSPYFDIFSRFFILLLLPALLNLVHIHYIDRYNGSHCICRVTNSFFSHSTKYCAFESWSIIINLCF